MRDLSVIDVQHALKGMAENHNHDVISNPKGIILHGQQYPTLHNSLDIFESNRNFVNVKLESEIPHENASITKFTTALDGRDMRTAIAGDGFLRHQNVKHYIPATSHIDKNKYAHYLDSTLLDSKYGPEYSVIHPDTGELFGDVENIKNIHNLITHFDKHPSVGIQGIGQDLKPMSPKELMQFHKDFMKESPSNASFPRTSPLFNYAPRGHILVRYNAPWAPNKYYSYNPLTEQLHFLD